MRTNQAAERARQIVSEHKEGQHIGPRMCPCVCGAGKHAHAGKNGAGGCPTTGCTRYKDDTAWTLAYRALDAEYVTLGHSLRDADAAERGKRPPRPEGSWSVRFSDLGTCPRKIWYRNKPPADMVYAPEDGREARMGVLIHEGAVARLKRLYPWRRFEQPVRVDGLDSEGRYDSYDPITGTVEDEKTAGDYKWDLIGKDGPDEETWGQLALYGLALEQAGEHVRTLRLNYIKRANGHDEPYYRPYDRAFAEKWRDYLLGILTALDLDLDLPRTESGPSNSEMCRRCFARIHCWSMDEAEALHRSPESYTILGEEPDDPTIALAIAERVRLGAVRLQAAKDEDEGKTLLEGVRPGVYGDYQGREQWGGGGDDPVARVRQIEGVYSLPETQRPPLDALPYPQKRRYSYVKWGKRRKADLEKEARDRAGINKGDLS